MHTSHDYSRDYEPAAPVIWIGLSPYGETDSRLEIRALVDTGADATMIPIDKLRSSGARYVQQHRLRGVVGESITVNLYLAAVHVAGQVIHGIRVVAVPEGSEAIVGRDVLNSLELTLNGPALEMWVM